MDSDSAPRVAVRAAAQIDYRRDQQAQEIDSRRRLDRAPE